MAEAKRDQNFVTSALFESSTTPGLTITGKIDQITGRVLVDASGGGSGTVTSITSGTGLTSTPNPITTSGTISLDSKLAPIDTLGSPGQAIRVNAGGTALEYFTLGGGTGTVTSVASADGSITVTNPTTTPDLAVVKAPIWSTARLLAGNSVNGSANVPFANKFIVQGTTDTGLTGAQFLGALTTGIVKNTTTTGVLSIATAGTDYEVPLTFSTGLTRSTNTVTVNTSQNISTLSNLTTNGLVTTSGGTGALSITTMGAGIATWLSTPSSANLAAAVTDETGSGALVFATSPTLVTPTLGAATATTINGNTFTTGSYTLTGVAGKTLTFNNTMILAGTDSSTYTFPGATATIAGLATTQTFTNKRVTPRIGTTASSSTPTPDGDNNDEYNVTALAANATFGAPTGTPTEGQHLIIRVKDNGTARTLAFNAIYRFSTDLAAPTTTILSKTLYLGFIYNGADNKWDNVAQLNNL